MRTATTSLYASAFLVFAGCGGGGGGSDEPAETVDAGARDATTKPVGDARVADTGHDAKAPSSGDAGSVTQPSACSSTSKGYCVAGSGETDGMSFTCSSAGDVTRTEFGTPSWVVDCDDSAMKVSVQVSFPVQAAGNVDLEAMPGQPGSLKFHARAFDTADADTIGSMTESSDNLLTGALTGTVGADGTLTGTLSATWDAPSSSCDSGDTYGGPCAEGSFKLSFRVKSP